MKKIVFIVFQLCLVANLFAQKFIPIWPENGLPNSKGLQLEYVEENERITQVVQPGIYSFLTSKEENKGSAVLICPPGGYQKLTYNIAGFQLANWFNTLGINAFVLIYRLPNSPDLIEREKGPIQDAQRALKLIRANASNWNINTNKIGIFGASAGGHLASTLGTHFQDYSIIGDSLDTISIQPNFMILISPVINMGEYAHKGSVNNFLGENATQEMIDNYSNEKHVSEKTPPTFLTNAQNDHVVPVINSILFYEAMIKKGIKGSLHIFPEGDHSISLRNKSDMVNLWTDLCEKWLKEIGMLENAN